MYRAKNNKPQTRRRIKRPLLIGLAVVATAGITLAILEYTDTTYIFHDRPVTRETQPNTPGRTINSDTKGEGSTSDPKDNNSGQSDNNGNTAPNPNSEDDKTPNDTNTSATLIEPSGQFVNTHIMSADGSDASGSSNCVTTPGAKCEIIFTKGSETKSLGIQTTDRGGATYWSWSPKSVGLSPGKWKIQAKATLGSQVKTASDATNLEIN